MYNSFSHKTVITVYTVYKMLVIVKVLTLSHF